MAFESLDAGARYRGHSSFPPTIQSCHNPRGAKISIRPPRNVGVPRLLGEDGHDQAPVGRASLRRDLRIRIPTLLPPPSSTSLAYRSELLRNSVNRVTHPNLHPLRIPHRHRPRHRALRHNGKGVEASCGSLGNIDIAISQLPHPYPSHFNHYHQTAQPFLQYLHRIALVLRSRAEHPPIYHPVLLFRQVNPFVSFYHFLTAPPPIPSLPAWVFRSSSPSLVCHRLCFPGGPGHFRYLSPPIYLISVLSSGHPC